MTMTVAEAIDMLREHVRYWPDRVINGRKIYDAVDVVTVFAQKHLEGLHIYGGDWSVNMMSEQNKLREAIDKARECFRFSVDEQKLTRPYRDEVREAIGLICEVAASTLPKTKMVETWHVESVNDDNADMGVSVFLTRKQADEEAITRRDEGYRCVRVTGPHQQEVPI